jgi:hypothetical protein
MLRELTSLWASLQDPEYLHLLLEPLPLFGLGLGLVFLLMSLLLGNAHTRILALVVIILSAGSVPWYLKMRVKAEPRIAATMDHAFQPLIKAQTERRQSSEWIYLAVAAICAIDLIFSRGGRRASLLSWVAAMCVAAGFVHGVWLHKKECEVYHPHIVRYVAPR